MPLLVKAVLVFVNAGLVDLAWALYIRRTAAGKAVAAANFGVLILALGAFNTLSFVQQPLLLAPIVVGGWLGTYLVVRYEHKEG